MTRLSLVRVSTPTDTMRLFGDELNPTFARGSETSLTIISTILSSLIAGIAGWFGTEFLARPIRRFFDLRGEVRQALFDHSTVRARWTESQTTGRSIPTEEADLSEAEEAALHAAQVRFRDLGHRMKTFADTEELAVRAVRLIGFDPMAAGGGLVGLSNALGTYGENRAHQRKAIMDALNFTNI